MMMTVLLSLQCGAWQLADFGLMEQGTSVIARHTRYPRGSEGYRGPETVKGYPVICQQTDIFALACIMHELATARKLFEREYDLFEYISTRNMQHIALPANDPRSQGYYSSIMNAMLEVDWWKRPSALDILDAVDSVQRITATSVIKSRLLDRNQGHKMWMKRVMNDEQKVERLIYVSEEAKEWPNIAWIPVWYASDLTI